MNSNSSRTRALSTVIAAAIPTALFGIAGFYYIAKDQNSGYGIALFILIPFTAAFAISIIVRPRVAAYSGIVLALASGLLGLFLMGLEGLLCIVFALPLILPGVGIGILTAFIVSKLAKNSHARMVGVFLVATLIPLSQFIDHPMVAHNTVTSISFVSAPPEKVWPHLLATTITSTSEPLLFKLGLPRPTHCSIDGEGIGATRTCYFENGYIREVVSHWDPPHKLGLRIIDARLPGRRWLGFESAVFELDRSNQQTTIVRSTDITSTLRPRWYWRTLEAIAVRAQHEYVLADIAGKAMMKERITRH